MNNKCIAFSMLFSVLTGSALADGKIGGADLFNHHGCINCHGADAKNPVSKVVPVLAGKSADELFNKGKKILSGEGGTEESKMMHAAFYSPSQCDSPPTDDELRRITSWISKL